MKLTKTERRAEITQIICGQTDRLSRRVWEDENGVEFVKINREVFDLDWYRRSKHHIVETWYDPC